MVRQALRTPVQVLEPHAQGPGLTAGPPISRSTRCGPVNRELEGHPGDVSADQQAQHPAQQAPEPGRLDRAVRDGLAVRGERHDMGLRRRGVGGRSGAEGLRDGQLRRSTVRVVDHEQRHAEQAEAPHPTAPTPTARSVHRVIVAGHLPDGVDVVAYCGGPSCLTSDDAVRAPLAAGRSALRLVDGFPEWAAAELLVERASA